MIEIKAIIPDIHGYDDQGLEVGGKIAEVEVNGKKSSYVRFGCIYSFNNCPLREGLKRGKGICDARNFQGIGRDAIKWYAPGLAVGCGRTENMKNDPPRNLLEYFPDHKFVEPGKRFKMPRS